MVDALIWSVVVPTGLYITRGVGSGVQTALRRPTPERLATDVLDVEGALGSAECALRFFPMSPTADHLRDLVSRSKVSLENLLAQAEDRRDRAGFLRIFRDPDFSDTNRLLRAGVETLKSRVHLYLLVVNIFPDKVSDKFPNEDNGAFERSIPMAEAAPNNELQYSSVADCEGANESTDSVYFAERWASMTSLVSGLGSFGETPGDCSGLCEGQGDPTKED